ncbi:MAG: glycosyltransferase WbsX family protein [Bacteroidales bacterium]
MILSNIIRILKRQGRELLIILPFLSACSGPAPGEKTTGDVYLVAAYVWPSCHDEPRSREVFWMEGTGEWEIIRKGDPRFEGHYQPKVPLWGYVMDNDPEVFNKKIGAAVEHGVDLFIFDWYWYDGKPFLESSLNDGFLGAESNQQMQFYLMWANHDVNGKMWNRYRYPSDTLIWEGEVDWEEYRPMVDHLVRDYFGLPNYFTIEGEPVFSIFSVRDLVNSFGGLQGTRNALAWFNDRAREAGFPGVHFQLISMGMWGPAGILPEEESDGMALNEIVEYLGIKSMTTYNWRMAGIREDYIPWAEDGLAQRDAWDERLEIPYFPVVSVGWDNTPRYAEFGQDQVVHRGNTPESFGAYLLEARSYADAHPGQPPLILINAWNEWVEGAYLEPDMKWGYGYLEAVKKAMAN